jgi:large subunit ribosomal protein L9
MELILKQAVRNLGDADEIVNVKPGYGRNFLLPQGLAVLATDSSRRALEEKKKQAAHKQEHLKAQAQSIADRLADTRLTIETLAGADGKLFGSVTAIAIANKLKEAGFDIDRKHITLTDIRGIGEYTAVIYLHREVKASVILDVVRKQD